MSKKLNIKITNDSGMPELFYIAIKNIVLRDYPGYIPKSFASVTRLLKPSYIIALENYVAEKGYEILVEASEYIWMIFGIATHYILEKAVEKNKNVFTEENIWTDVMGERITGRPDYYDIKTGVIHDLKTTSVYKVINNRGRDEWENQLNVYSYLFRKHNVPVNGLNVIALMKDWSKTHIYESGYPKYAVKNIKINNLWTEKEQHDFIATKIHDIKNAIFGFEKHPGCSPSERWEKPTVYAVMHENKKKAVRVKGMDTPEIAQAFIDGHKDKKKLYIQERPGERTRCKYYCIVNEYCPYWKECNK